MQHIAFIVPVLLSMTQAPSPKNALAAEFEKQVAAIEKATIPDKRLDVFQAEAVKSVELWDIKGETTVTAARDAVVQAARSAFGAHLGKIEIKLLPDPALGEKNQALVRVSVAPMRKVPRHTAEMVDQVVMGTLVKLVKEEPGWFLVQTPYRYVGWIEKLMLVRVTAGEAEAWTASPSLARYAPPVGTVWSRPDQQEAVCDLVLADTLRTGTSQDGLTAVTLPDGRTGFVAADSLLPIRSSHRQKPNPNEMVVLALRLRGIPYLWGGNSAKGFDCSGFVQTVFRMNDVELPRDADQQAAVGTPIEPASDFANVRPGDLLFFGKDRITHVGMSLGGARFIHASGDVNIRSLSPQDQDFDQGRRDTLKLIKRVVGE